MKRQLLKIDHLKKIQNAIFAMTLTGDCSEILSLIHISEPTRH